MAATIEFNATGIGAVAVRIPADEIFLTSSELDYTFAVLPSCPAGLIPVPLRRGKDCGVINGDSVQVRL